MASVGYTLCFIAALLLFYQKTATCDFLSPLLSPVFDNICKEVECGKGNCKASSNTPFMYECECENGWKQFDHHFKFLPCVIPNCTFDLACGEAPSPTQPKTPPKDNNTSLFDACQWVDCGGGLCNKTLPFSYSCECREGYKNLMNITTFPCFKQCKKNNLDYFLVIVKKQDLIWVMCLEGALGLDCLNLGIPLSNASSSSPPALPDSSKNQAAGLNIRGPLLTSLLCVCLVVPWRLLYI